MFLMAVVVTPPRSLTHSLTHPVRIFTKFDYSVSVLDARMQAGIQLYGPRGTRVNSSCRLNGINTKSFEGKHVYKKIAALKKCFK